MLSFFFDDVTKHMQLVQKSPLLLFSSSNIILGLFGWKMISVQPVFPSSGNPPNTFSHDSPPSSVLNKPLSPLYPHKCPTVAAYTIFEFSGWISISNFSD